MPKVFSTAVTKSENRYAEAVFTFQMEAGVSAEILNEAIQLRKEIQTTNVVIRDILYKIGRLDLHDSYVDQILSITVLAFASPLPDSIPAKSLLLQLREDFVMRAGQKFRLIYVRQMSIAAVCIAASALIYACIPLEIIISSFYLDSSIPKLLRAGAWALVGISLSTWMSAILRNRTLKWDTLTIFDPDGFPPILRFALVTSVTFLLALLLYVDVIKIGVGTLDLGQFFRKPAAATLLGIVGGLSEASLTKLVVGRVQSFTTTAS